ncbi:MAG: ATP-dependent zinc metalloprotease FtsH [Vicinamibacterales bacterium]
MSLRKRLYRWWVPCAAVTVVLAAAVYLFSARSFPPADEAPFSDFLKSVEAGSVSRITLSDQWLVFVMADGAELRTVPPPGYVASNPAFLSSLVAHNVSVMVKPRGDQSGYGVATLAIGLAFLGLVGLVVYRMSAGRIPSLESRAHESDGEKSVVTFADVAGVDEAKDEVKEIVDFLKEPEKFQSVGGRMPKGVLLVGPPGTGKTLLARSIAGEAGVPFLFASGSDFVEMYAGVGAARVRRLFRDAGRHKSCIVFIDELDAVGRKRGGNSLSHEEREQTLNQLLVEMDGFAMRQGVVVIAATNRADILDPALLRPGRFDRQVVVGGPDLKGREAILRVHTRKVKLEPGVDLRAIARGTPGFSGADLANLVNEAALLAARHGRHTVSDADFDEARDKVLMGVERRSLVMSEQERVNCAYHESGHALVAALVPGADPLHKVTIVPRGRALGVTMQLPEADRHTYTREFMEAQIAILMGGRVAEEVFMGHPTSGASNDIERATDLAEKMVCQLGMSPLGPLAFRKVGNGWDAERGATMSEETARRVDEEIRAIVMHGYDEARRLLQSHHAVVHALARELLEVESLDAADIGRIIDASMRSTPVSGPYFPGGAIASAAGESGHTGGAAAVYSACASADWKSEISEA